MTAWSVGTQLGPFELASQIGEGGMGEVWKARDTKLDRDVALGNLPASFDSDRLLRFEREAGEARRDQPRPALKGKILGGRCSTSWPGS